MSYRSPLGKVLGLGNHSGAHHWWLQRLTSVALLLLSIWLVHIFITNDWSYASAHLEISRPGNWVPMALLVTLGLYHSWLGLRVVVEDYVHHKLLKFVTLMSLELLHLALLATGLFALLKIVVEAPL